MLHIVTDVHQHTTEEKLGGNVLEICEITQLCMYSSVMWLQSNCTHMYLGLVFHGELQSESHLLIFWQVLLDTHKGTRTPQAGSHTHTTARPLSTYQALWVSFTGESLRKSLALVYFANKVFVDCTFVLAIPFRRYSIREYNFHTQQLICEICEKQTRYMVLP